jgi:hypothetical protein
VRCRYILQKNPLVELLTLQKRQQAASLHRGDTCHESRSNESQRAERLKLMANGINQDMPQDASIKSYKNALL